MPYSPERHHRRSLRLPGHDYSHPGMYFITICIRGREFLFGEVVRGEMVVNEYGRVVHTCWEEIPCRFRHVELDAFVLMPNHIHGILVIADRVEAAPRVGAIHELPLQSDERYRIARRRMLVPKIVGRFKMNAAKRINDLRNTPGVPLWQRNYYEHVIRSEGTLHRIREYILTNPLRWELDQENPARRGEDEFDRWLASLSPKGRGDG